MELGLYYYNARYYVPGIGRFASADTIVPQPGTPQSLNRYSYSLNNPVRYTDPSGHSCADAVGGYPAEAYDCTASNVFVFYLNGLGGNYNYGNYNPLGQLPELDALRGEYGYTFNLLRSALGKDNVAHVPVFFEPYERGRSQVNMIAEAFELSTSETDFAANFIENHLAENPLRDAQRLVLVGSSAGGTIAVELLDALASRGISVDQVIARGSPIHEPWIGNVNRLDYIAAENPYSDHYYSVDVNPFDVVNVKEHRVRGFTDHVPEGSQVPQIGNMIMDLIVGGSQ